MRLTSIAAGILVLAASAYLLARPSASRASALGRSAFQESGPRGPLIDPSRPNQESQTPQQQEPPQSSAPLQVQTTVVNVFTTVRDRHNGIVSDLTKNDFKVFEDGVEQKISYFTKEVDLPLSLALLMDTSGSMQEILNAEKEAASNFVQEVMHKKDEAIVMSFDTDVNLLADFSEDPGYFSTPSGERRSMWMRPASAAPEVPCRHVEAARIFMTRFIWRRTTN